MADRSPRQRALAAGATPEPLPVAPAGRTGPTERTGPNGPTQLPRRRPGREDTAPERGTGTAAGRGNADGEATSPGRPPRAGQPAQVRRLGRPFDRQSPFVVGFSAALGVLVAIAIGAAVYSIRSTLVLVFVSLFIAVGLDPVVVALTQRHVRRHYAVIAVLLAAVCIVGAFVYSAISPINAEVHQLVKEVPIWRNQLATGRGTLGHIARFLHLSTDLKNLDTATLAKALASGALGAGKAVLSTAASTLIVAVLTIYFLAALPSIKHFFAQLVPGSRRERFYLLLDEVLAGVGGYLIGNLFTSLVAGVGTYLWAIAFGIPYPLLLGLLVALFDLIPVVGSTIAGVVVSLVALSVSLPVAVATAAFYVGYRFFEDYLLVPRVMRQAVNVSPVVTVLAVLIGGALLGIVGALVAIPVAASIKLVLEQRVFPRLDSN
jgi:predicted PurR-regulated permease PerM